MLSFRAYHLDGTFWGEPTSGILEYEQEHTEGPYMAKFLFRSGESGVGDTGLKSWFRNRLMTEIQVLFNGVDEWRGYVWEMELELDGKIRIKSMADMANAVKCRYTNTDGNSIFTGWSYNSESIARYGRKEKIVSSNSSSGSEAEERAEAELFFSSSPYNKTITRVAPGENTLRVTLAGRIVLGNNTMILPDSVRANAITNIDDPLYDPDEKSIVYNSATVVSEEIRRLASVIQKQTGWLYPLDIVANDTETVVGVSSETGAWDRIVELARLRNSNGQFYRLQVTNNGGIIYRPFVEEEDYIHYPGQRGIRNLMDEIPTWDAKPGFIRDLDDQSGVGMPDTWLNDNQLSFYERTVMRDGNDIAEFHGKDLDAADVYGALDANRSRMEKPAEPVEKKEKEKKSDGHPWDWRFT
jgi:hypothetical protein